MVKLCFTETISFRNLAARRTELTRRTKLPQTKHRPSPKRSETRKASNYTGSDRCCFPKHEGVLRSKPVQLSDVKGQVSIVLISLLSSFLGFLGLCV